MLNYVRLCRGVLVYLAAMLLSFQVSAQIFSGERQASIASNALDKVLTQYEVYRIDVAALNQFIQTNPSFTPVELNIGDHQWKMELEPSNILAPGYTVQVASDNGIETYTRSDHRAFKGIEQTTGGRIRLTLDHQFLYGFVEENGERFYLEPLWYHEPGADRDLFVLYSVKSVIYDSNRTCIELASQEDARELIKQQGKVISAPESSGCYELQIAIASDKSMFNKYGSVAAVENHNIGVLNDVQGDYTGNFNNDIEFVIVLQFVVTGTDPWTASTNPDDVINSFSAWGNSNGFGTLAYDVAELWTNRDFDGAVIGIAYQAGLCNSGRYHCLQDFTSNAQQLRCLASHEIGHNFNASHDPTTGGSCPPLYIMCPFVSSTTVWSTASQTSINNYMNVKINSGCLSPCGTAVPLVADFDWSPNPACKQAQVHFTDLSTGPVTSRQWTFQGGTPATSTATNPNVTWANAGTYNVTLTVNGGGAPSSKTKQVTILQAPVANFTYTRDELTYTFTNMTTGGSTYNWDFGDGNTSNETDPIHTYSTGGIYTVVLTALNDCGSSTKTILINTIPTADFSATPTSGCATLVVQLNNESSPNASTFLWEFPGGSPTSSNQTNPIVVYSTSGVYTITLTATNGTGSTTFTRTNYITVQNIPSSGFNFTTNNQTVTFTNTSTGGTSYSWNFGDDSTSTQANPTHTYATGGVYTVTLTTTNICGSVTSTHIVSLTAPPVASFSASATSGCGPLTVQFSSTSTGNPTSYLWSFPGGVPDTSTAANPTVVYNNPGTYTVTLTATNIAGSNTATQSGYITVNTGPTAGFSSAVNGLTATFTNTSSSNSASYAWNFGDGNSSTAASPQHTYASDGTYTVTLTATNPCGTNTSTQIVTIVTPPVAGFSAATTSGCAPLTVQFTNTSSANAVTYNWSFPGGTPSSSTAASPSVVYSAAGVYTVTLVASNAAGSNTSTQTSYITVNTAPVAGFTAAVNNATATFTNSSTNAASYSWNFGDGNTSTLQSPSHVYAADGTYTVTLTATNPCGPSTTTQTVTIVTPPTAGFTANATTGCGPLTVQFTNTSSANAVNFNWAFPGGNPASSTAANPTVVYNAPGTYTVTLTVSNAAGSNSTTQTSYITVNPDPTAGFSAVVNGATATFSNSSANAASYNWNFGDGNSSTQQNPTHNYTADGVYTVTLISVNPCGMDTSAQTITIVTPPTAGFTANQTSGCAPLSVQFTSTSSANAVSFNWSFPGGTPASSTAQNPLVTYNAAGAYTVTLVVGNAAGSNTSTQTSYVHVMPAPTAGFTSSTNGATATFSNTSSNGVTYSWNFGDGNSSTDPNPTHTYANDGTYTVTLTATNPCGTNTFTQSVVIITSPNAGFTAATTSGCGPLTVQFQDLSSGNTTAWLWTFPGGTPATSTQQNPMVVYNAPGTYSVTLVASTAAGSSTFTQSNFIHVLPLPTPAFSAGVSGATATFTNASVNATAYLWDFGDGSTSNASDPSHQYTADGTYTVTLTATNNCGSVTSTQTVTILLPPLAAFNSNLQTGCAPLTVQFANQSSATAVSYAWTFQGGSPASSGAANPTVTWDTPGTYSVTLVAGNASGTTSATSTIIVKGPPAAGFTTQTAGLSVVLSNTSTNATSYLWDFGDGTTSTDANPTHTYAGTGSFIIVLRAINDCGETVFTQTVEIVGTAPLAAFTANEQVGCIPLTVQFTDQSAGNPTGWAWTFEGGTPPTSSSQNPSVTYSSAGTFAVTLVVTNAFGNSTTSQQQFIKVIDLPTAGFNFSPNQTTVAFENKSTNGDTYFWNFGDGTTSTEANPMHTYPASGTYTVELTVSNNCGASTLQQMVTLASGTGEADWLQQFKLYPNPNPGIFTVELSGKAHEELAFVLLNAIGQQIKRETVDFSTGNLKHQFNYGMLPAGVYQLQIRSGLHMMQVKLAIQR